MEAGAIKMKNKELKKLIRKNQSKIINSVWLDIKYDSDLYEKRKDLFNKNEHWLVTSYDFCGAYLDGFGVTEYYYGNSNDWEQFDSISAIKSFLNDEIEKYISDIDDREDQEKNTELLERLKVVNGKFC